MEHVRAYERYLFWQKILLGNGGIVARVIIVAFATNKLENN